MKTAQPDLRQVAQGIVDDQLKFAYLCVTVPDNTIDHTLLVTLIDKDGEPISDIPYGVDAVTQDIAALHNENIDLRYKALQLSMKVDELQHTIKQLKAFIQRQGGELE